MTSRLIATLASWLVASLVGLLGVASPAAAAPLGAPVATYAYNAPASSAEITGVATERGPPAIADGPRWRRPGSVASAAVQRRQKRWWATPLGLGTTSQW